MAFTFPLTLAEFWEILRVRNVTWLQQDNSQLSGMGSGQILESELAPMLRIADVTCLPVKSNHSALVEARLETVRLYKGSFYAYDPRKCVPAADPLGKLLGTATPTIKAFDTQTLSLKGLPPYYPLKTGDCLSFAFGTNPVRQAYHRLLEDANTDSAGETDAFAVSPFVMGGVAVDTPVELIKPRFKAIIRPGTIDIGTTQFSNRTSISFSLVQKL